ncbi:outer membrane protein with beta-barrel domain [Balneicella halophila]|uniref:Outer membrane protein with beta-barrel domain n=1 Tax=Balneicella halophila TaxID=1537566 RepID=A0A7L4URS2_BALHA|nr:DUF6089 family protein [Balneicella halophila]PVX52349.1 outer membrane protein with beta-barrel domain [Balneicella halophila]
MKYLFYTVFALFPCFAFGQPASSIDIGAGVGMSSYYGDINQNKLFYNPNISFDGIIRYNFSNRYSLRANVMSTKLKADDIDFENPYQQSRKEFFVRNIFEIGVLGEVNFFPYINPHEWGHSLSTIYATLGAGYAVSYVTGQEDIGSSSIIFGVGYKRVLTRRFAVEAEWAFRKLVNDEFDNVVDPIKTGETSKLFNNDWYNVIGVRLTYNFWQNGGKCRTFEKDTDL